VGFAVTLAPFTADSPAEGDQEYTAPPPAVKTVDEPLQIATPVPELILIVGNGFTATVTVAELVQPSVLLPVIVYVVVLTGFAVTLAAFVEDRPDAGAHI